MRAITRRVATAAALAAASADCERGAPAPAPGSHASVAPAAFDADAWRPPSDSAIPNDSLGASIRRGLALVLHTTDSLPSYAPGHITCSNCHLAAGRGGDGAIPFGGAHARYPRYMDRAGAVVSMIDRVNYCFTRSLAGRRLPAESREMADILTYVAFVSRGVPVGARTPNALPAMHDTLVGDTARGGALFRTTCATCHGADGQGGPAVPALWGPRSFSIGASMAREERAASFIWHNMPLGRGRSLTPQQAFDVAAFVNAHPRPDSPGKEHDWPGGGAPADVPYDTKSGHRAHRPPPLLARAHAADALVPPPPRAAPAHAAATHAAATR